MRVFVALDLPDDVRDAIEDLQDVLPVGRPVAPENLHLTLCFLGEQPEDAIEAAHDALSSVRRPVFTLELAGVGTFGRISPNVVFADVVQCAALIDFQKALVRSLRHAGLEFQRQRFRPHVTLARLPKDLAPHDLARLGDFLAGYAAFRSSGFRVAHFQLYHSTLMPGGARHDILASYNLTAG
jgi:2'-5' RNA ligase